MRRILSYLRRAVDDYKMIQEGDKIAVGLSGGKDSILTMLALASYLIYEKKKIRAHYVLICEEVFCMILQKN